MRTLLLRSLAAASLAAASFASASLLATPLAAQTVSFGGQTLRTNVDIGAIAVNGGVLQMMDGTYGASHSALTTSTFNLNGPWSTNFRMSFDCVNISGWCPGDGIGFVVSNGPDTDVGVGGGSMGYENSFMGASYAVMFRTFWGDVFEGRNGAFTTQFVDGSGNAWASNFVDAFDVALAYDGSGALNWSVTRVSNSAVFSGALSGLNATDWSNARVGFTASTGSAAENSYVENWNWTQRANVTVPEPSTVVLLAAGLSAMAVAARRRRA